MGIRGLYTHLQPYGTKVDFLPTDGPKRSLIIDGPAFAYYIYYQCVAQKPKSAHPFERIPSYKEIIDFALHWLSDVEKFGLVIKKIYFDGVLPLSKETVRLERLQSSLQKLLDIRTRSPSLELHLGDPSAFIRNNNVSMPDSRFVSVPSPPFLVTAIFHALKASKYCNESEIVLAEADSACADPTVCESSDIILTSDTDLLILQPQGYVIFFNDITLYRGAKLKAICYKSKSFATHLGIKDLVTFAYIMSQDNALPLATIVCRSNNLSPSTALHLFRQSFNPIPSSIKPSPTLSSALQALDNRTSEVIHTLLTHEATTQPINSYLPTLLDDPTRSSAYRASFTIRHLGYSLLAHTTRIIAPMNELDRRGSRIASLLITPLDPSATLTALAALTAQLHDLHETFAHSDATPTETWRAVALLATLCWEGQPLGSLVSVAKLTRLARGTQKRGGWEEVHLAAMVEGWVWSIGMLRGCVGVCLALDAEELKWQDMGEEGMKVLREFISGVQGMSGIGALLPWVCGALSVGGCAEEVCRQLGKMVGADETEMPKRKKLKRTKQAKQDDVEKSTRGKSNMYDLLDPA